MLVVGLAYIVAEYSTQSHLATKDFGKASQGLIFTRRFKKYTYWFRSLLGLSDKALLVIWKLVRSPWERATGLRPTAFNKTLYWDWKVKSNTADGTATRALGERARRRSSTQPLREGSQDEESSRGSRSPERSENDRRENETQDGEHRDSRGESPPRIRMPTLQLPTQTHARSRSL